jgi:multimeric flavodoxin WrbA
MKIVVLNGSPKGATSVTMQYVQYIQKMFPQHELSTVDIALRGKKIEGDESAFQEIVEQVRVADGVLWAFPLYILAVHANYKRFIELIWERGAESAFEGKYAASLSTSVHYFDHTAHNYIQAICDDLGMRYVDAFSPKMRDLLEESGRAQTQQFAQHFFDAVERRAPTVRRYPPLVTREFAYAPGPGTHTVEAKGKQVVLVTDAEPQQVNLRHMIERFRGAFAGDVDAINLHDLDIKGGCLGCLRCGYDYECAYTGKDEFIEFYNTRIKTADIVVFAGAMRDRYLSATWKNFFDRAFFNTHTPTLVGKQLAFLISGPLGQNENLREILQGWTELQCANLAGIVTDEAGDSAQVDGLLQDLAENLVWYAVAGYIRPHTFLGVGGIKVLRDDIWGRLRMVFMADHRAYKRLGFYDWPQNDYPTRIANAIMGLLLRSRGFREGFKQQAKQQMVQPYRKIVQD